MGADRPMMATGNHNQLKGDFIVTYEGMTNEEVLADYRQAVENLPGTGARGRSWLAKAEAEMMKRLAGPKAVVNDVEYTAESLLNQIEQDFMDTEETTDHELLNETINDALDMIQTWKGGIGE
jgi:hypothetical protein